MPTTMDSVQSLDIAGEIIRKFPFHIDSEPEMWTIKKRREVIDFVESLLQSSLEYLIQEIEKEVIGNHEPFEPYQPLENIAREVRNALRTDQEIKIRAILSSTKGEV